MPNERDDEIVQLLVSMGTGRKTAMRQLARTRDRPAFLRRLKEEKRLENLRFERHQKKLRQDRWADDGRANLREALTTARWEARAASKDGHPVKRLAEALGRLWLNEAGPVRAASLSPTALRGGESADDGPPGTFQPGIVAQEWEARLGRLADLLEHELDLVRGEATVFSGMSSQDRDRRILNYVGDHVALIAYVEQVDVRSIQRLCRRARDNDLDQPVPEEFRGVPFRVRNGHLVIEAPLEEVA